MAISRLYFQLLAIVLVTLQTATPVAWAGQAPEPTVASLDLEPLDALPGFFDIYWDDATGHLQLIIKKYDEPFLYVSSLASGLGSNPVGLDRGQIGDTRIVRFKRVGKRVYLVQMNLKYRAVTDNLAERKAVQDSFAESIIWSGEIKPTSDGQDSVDLTEFLLRDAHDCVGVLASTGQGSYALNTNLSYLNRQRTKSFPKNTEMEAALTFTTSKAGPLASRTAADGRSVTLRQHHSFVELPDDAYRPRKWDPRVGCFSVDFADYSAPIDQPTENRLIARHRLVKAHPDQARSAAVKPIVYYVDPGVPQPVRDALVSGAQWWNTAFEAAGFVDAFQVKVLPEDADPMDVRYNVIQWVHRATRGWSYGQSAVDPRTGEIIKGHVLLGSLRVRQDHLLFEGLGGTAAASDSQSASFNRCSTGSLDAASTMAAFYQGNSSTELALARIRQLSAHEVGHTLGFAHNFAASTYADRASVMDYPAPRIDIQAGKLDFSNAYGIGVGQWDVFTVQYAYSQFPSGAEEQQLAALIDDALEKNMLYISDADSRPAGAAHPLANLWDNGSDPAAALTHALQVREIGLQNFSADSLAAGQPLSDLERTFVPVYLHHRYQVEAAAKMLGGVMYRYAVQGEAEPSQSEIPAADQRRALQTLLDSIKPSALIIEQRILDLLPPKVTSSASDRERFDSNSSPLFDSVQAMEVAADLTLSGLLQPQRAARLAGCQQADWNLDVVLTEITKAVYTKPEADPRLAEAQRVALRIFVQRLIELSDSPRTHADVHAIAVRQLATLQPELETSGSLDSGPNGAHYSLLSRQIQRHLARPAPTAESPSSPEPPPGSPIGQQP